MKIKLIHNPYANRWQSSKRKQEILSSISNAGLSFDYYATQKPGDAIQAAKQASEQGFDIIIAAGGDGTIGEVVNGMMQSGNLNGLPKLGILPVGTANDLASNLKLPLHLPSAARLISNGISRRIDLIQVNDWYFINNAGLGLEPYTTRIQEKIKSIKGVARYMVAVFIGIAKNPQWQMSLEWDQGKYHGPITMVSIGNNSKTGGIFYTVPHADPFDGKLTFVYSFIPTRLKILKALPKILKPDQGNYIEHPAVHEIHSSWLKVRLNPPSPAHADGELFNLAIHEAEYKVYPGAIDLITGA